MAKMTPEQAAAYALDFNIGRDTLKRPAQAEYDRLKAERARGTAATPRTTTKVQERTPSNVLMLGALLGWGPWSAAIGAWQAFGNSGYTIGGRSASTSAAHNLCQAGQSGVQPGICGSIDAHYAFGIAMLVIGSVAFIGGLIALFVVQQSNPRTWRQAAGPIIAGLCFGILAVIAMVVIAIARGVRQGPIGPSNVSTPQTIATASSQLPGQGNGMTTSAAQVNAQWRVSAGDGWEWLASDGKWYPQQLAPAGFLPPAPPPPSINSA
jgi:hypothetical protein